MRLTIAHICGKICTQLQSFVIDIDPSSTILHVKEKIAQNINVPSCNQFLSIDCRTLEDEHTLASYDFIKDGTQISMVISRNATREKLNVYVTIPISNKKRDVISLDIFYYDTVAQVKQAISERTSIPTTKQRIIFAGKQLDDNRIFANYGIQRESTVHLVMTE